MQSIQTIFERQQVGKKFLAVPVINTECQWVFKGEGTPTIKWDGSACLFKDGVFYKRHRLKNGKKMPAGWRHHTFDIDQVSGHGWVPVLDTPDSQYHLEAFRKTELKNGKTYELVGPMLQKNPYELREHELWEHGTAKVTDLTSRNFVDLEVWMHSHHHEGIVWHHPDGRMAKLKKRDFDIPWPEKKEKS